MENQAQLIALIAQVKNDPSLAGKLTSDSHLLNDAGLDSLQLINLILLVESEFGLEIDLDTLNVEHLSSVQRFTQYLGGQQS
jgi:acyl carrier protein